MLNNTKPCTAIQERKTGGNTAVIQVGDGVMDEIHGDENNRNNSNDLE